MKIWLATGGTGGHIFPALAVGAELLRRGHKVIVSSDGRGMAMVKKGKKFNTAFVWAGGVGGKSKIKQVIALGKIVMSAAALTLRFMIFRPNRVVAFGGYASVPAVLAARVWKIPTLLHEQNAAIGRANKFSLRWIKTLMTSFPKVEGIGQKAKGKEQLKIVYTGLPVRKDFTPSAFCLLPSAFRLLITGGSLGAQILDETVPQSVAALPSALQKKLFITHQTRPENVAKLQQFYAGLGIRANVLSFIHDMAGEIAAASLIIGRSGASTVAELQTVGRPAIFVPLSINPDQAANAASFAAQGAGFAVAQDKFTVKWLSATLEELFDNPARLEKMAGKALVPNNAVENIVAEIER
ncbi:MAG: UDP-N-acetylglucosamine--N-acetylmuramyl-(pentapeptide) pyrophosphoryl-undecaprenol N-acetylglucosamine transferase [Rickettsiales bacterium]|jgi:UDP-N-acetylglucosamine--N-acetylmuramyl-(pentapeptide) pyrophosphoryl-undecaprenol N-acetylglucosamine transferase|nr:UDP-N-acetylglucosamine--N-acetylmuramyl-(pentapeptide) pyrophosphoryl-undecaprenol N-acetylglucosamine transferase [Rickettsiales bacterium]